MRIAAIYDIHGNLPALEAVLDEVQAEKVDIIVVGGDVIAGPMPSESLTLLQTLDLPVHFIRGNSESEFLRCINGKAPGGISAKADEVTRWTTKVMSKNQKQFIADWPATLELKSDVFDNVCFCHATPHSDIRVFTQQTPYEILADIFEGIDTPLVVCGHTHMQFDLEVNGIRVVNAGSVGMPFGGTGAEWLILGDRIEFKHTNYDLSNAANILNRSGYPEVDTFISDNLLSPPSRQKALAMLSQLENMQKDHK